VRAAIDLDERSTASFTETARAMLGGATASLGGEANRDPDATNGLPRNQDPLALPELLSKVAVVEPGIGGPDQKDDPISDLATQPKS
jgi:hypothetical protein